MNLDVATALLDALGSKLQSHTSQWARSSCPLSRYLHAKAVDTHPSFGLFIEENSSPRFHCFTCESGSLSKLLQTLEFHTHQNPGYFTGDLKKAREIIELAESELPLLPEYSEFGQQQDKVFTPLTTSVLSKFVPVNDNERAKAYCVKRGLSDSEVVQYGLRYDPDRDMLCAPYTDVWGTLAGVRGRKITLEGEAAGTAVQHHDYLFNGVNNSNFVFFNEQVLALPGPVVVVEGQFDCMKVARVWPKVIANLTAKPIMAKASKLEQCADPSSGVILLLDGDQTGRTATEKWIHLLQYKDIPVVPLYLPWDAVTGVKSDPDSIESEWLENKFKEIGLLS